MKTLGILALSGALFFQSDFLHEQKRFERVRTAIGDKEALVSENLRGLGLAATNFYLLIVAYKDESVLEIYVRKKTETRYRKAASYPICARSGELGPKRF